MYQRRAGIKEHLLNLCVMEGLWGPNSREKPGFTDGKKQKKKQERVQVQHTAPKTKTKQKKTKHIQLLWNVCNYLIKTQLCIILLLEVPIDLHMLMFSVLFLKEKYLSILNKRVEEERSYRRSAGPKQERRYYHKVRGERRKTNSLERRHVTGQEEFVCGVFLGPC